MTDITEHIRTGQLTVKPQTAFLQLASYTDEAQPFLIIDQGNQRMSTHTNNKVGKQPRWNDEFQYLIHGDVTTMKLLMADRLAAHGDSDTQLFVEAEIDLSQFLNTKYAAKDQYSNWYNLNHDGKNCGQIQFMFEFEGRQLTEEEHSYQSLPMEHMYDYVFRQWEYHTANCEFHKGYEKEHVYCDDSDHVHGPKPGEKVNFKTCREKAKSLGFTFDEKTSSLIYNGEVVATKVMEGYYEDDDDYTFWDGITVHVWYHYVVCSGVQAEVGADRPGLSYYYSQSFTVGTLDEDNKFTKNETYERNMDFDR